MGYRKGVSEDHYFITRYISMSYPYLFCELPTRNALAWVVVSGIEFHRRIDPSVITDTIASSKRGIWAKKFVLHGKKYFVIHF